MTCRTVPRSVSAFIAMLLLSATAHAGFRSYISSTGIDNPTCGLPAPCRLLPAALDAVVDGGEIWMLDSANYNTAQVNIAKSVTILSVPGAVGSVVATGIGGYAINIYNPGVEVVLRNLVIVPFPGGGGTNGVVMTAGNSLTIENCVIADMPGSGIFVGTGTTANVQITDTTIRGNNWGLFINNGAHATVTRATISRSITAGVLVVGDLASTTTTADIGDSTIDGSTSDGVRAQSTHATAALKVSVHDSRLIRNSGYGVVAQSDAGANVWLSASSNVISNNGIGIRAAGTGTKASAGGNTVGLNFLFGLVNATGAVFESAGNNVVRNNGAAVSGSILTVNPI